MLVPGIWSAFHIWCPCLLFLLQALERTVESMQESGYSLDRVAFFVLIREYARGGRMDMAEGVLERMEEAGCPADARCFEALLAGFGRAGMLDKAEATLQVQGGPSDWEHACDCCGERGCDCDMERG